MNVLLLARNIYEATPNGGSNFYKILIDSNKKHQFFYRTDKKSKVGFTQFPVNVYPIFSIDENDFIKSIKMLSKNRLDIIDIPSWDFEADLLVEKLKNSLLEINRIYLGLHGYSSEIEKFSYIQTVNKKRLQEIKKNEQQIAKLADIYYSISYENLKKLNVKNAKKILIKYNSLGIVSRDLNKNFHQNNKKNEKIIGFAGRPEGTKGLDYLLFFVKKYHKKNIHYNLALSTSVRLSEFIFLSHYLNLNCPRCKIYWNLNKLEMENFYGSLNYYVAPSRYDAFNLTVLESFSRNIKVLTSNSTGSIHSIIVGTRNTENLYIFKTNNYYSFRRQLFKMLNNRIQKRLQKKWIRLKFKFNNLRQVEIDSVYD